MKKPTLIVLLVFLLLALVGCSGDANKNVVNRDTDTSMELSYDLFSGENTKTVELKANAQISVDIITNGGDFALSITDEDGKSAYTGNKIPSGSFVVTVDKDGKYSLKVTAISHVGGYKITWE